jgi:hypothetical protein
MAKVIQSIWFRINKLILKYLSDSIYFNILFLVNCIRLRKKFYYLNIINPLTFNEKILKRKKLDLELKSLFSDKIELRNLLLFNNVKVNTPKIFQVFKNEMELREFDFSGYLNTGFVLKANHGSGLNKLYFVKELPTEVDINEIAKWFFIDSSINSREFHYDLIDKKVFMEELLQENINDYKFHCFESRVKFIQVDIDRFVNHTRNIYDREWNLQEFEINYKKSCEFLPKPVKLDEMIALAEIIAKLPNFGEYIRIDLYENKSNIYLGELTFHPGGGVEPFDSFESDLHMGSFLICK